LDINAEVTALRTGLTERQIRYMVAVKASTSAFSFDAAAADNCGRDPRPHQRRYLGLDPVWWAPRKRMCIMSRTRREFTPEYKDEAVKLVISTGRAVATVARERGIN